MTKRSNVGCVAALAGALVLTGCLRTRSDVKEVEQRQVLAQTVNTLQKDNADGNARFSEVNEELRELRGRVEVVENRLQSGNATDETARKGLMEQNQELTRRLILIQESVTKMDLQIQALNAELMAVKADRSAQTAREATAAAKDPFEQGKEHFGKKDWKSAILSLQKYREASPKGKNVPEATYLIGVCFQELGMRDEARTFYEEVVGKFPKSGEAKKARTRLKSLKK